MDHFQRTQLLRNDFRNWSGKSFDRSSRQERVDYLNSGPPHGILKHFQSPQEVMIAMKL